MAGITLYGFNLSPPYRAVLLTARAIGVQLQEKFVDFQKMEHLTQEFLKMNPCHTVPALTDGDLRIWESRAIMCYLVNEYSKDDHLYPTDPKKRAEVDNMLYFDADVFFASLQAYIKPVFLGKEPVHEKRPMVIESVKLLEAILGDRKYVAGDRLTIADLSLVISLSVVQVVKINLDEFPAVKSWSARVKGQLPFYEEVTREGADSFRNAVAHKIPN